MIAKLTNHNSKSETQDLANAYTDAPKLHTNLFLGSLQLLFWLFFHPSAWRNHVACINPNLRPDFCLAELNRVQWRHPALRWLLVQGYLVLPLTAGFFAGVILSVLGVPYEKSAVGVGVGVAAGVSIGVALSVGGSLVGGIAAAFVVGLAGSTTFGLVSSRGNDVMVGAALVSAGSLTFGAAGGAVDDMSANIAAVGVLFSVTGGIALGIAGGVTGSTTSRGLTHSFTTQLGAIAIGVLVCVVMYAVAAAVAAGVAVFMGFGVAATVAVAMSASAAVAWRTLKWHRAGTFGVAFGVVFGITFLVAARMAIDLSDDVATGVVISVAGGVAFSLWISAFFSLPFVLGERIAGPWAGAVSGALGAGGVFIVYWITLGGYSLPLILVLNLTLILWGLSLFGWLPLVLYPVQVVWNTLLYQADERRIIGRPSMLHLQSVVQDQLRGLPSSVLDKQPPFLGTWNTLLHQLEQQHIIGRPSLLRRHSAFWDEHQRLRLPGLDAHLVLVAERDPVEGQAAIEYVATSRQRWAAQAAQIELDARQLERCADVAAVSNAHRGLAAGKLTGPANALLRALSRISQDVEAALHQESTYNQRLALSAVEDRLDGLLRELTRSSERYAVRFRSIARQWRQIVAGHVQYLVDTVELRQEIDSPYVIGVPLTEHQEIFVGRTDVGARIEGLLLDRRRPPLLLYGQRRTGKTSLLNNLGRLLPSTIVPLFVDLQGPASQASDHAGFLYNLARGMIYSAQRQRDLALPLLSRQALAADPFTCFDEWLDQVESALGGNTVLLALDEFETLDHAFATGRLEEEAVLGMLRHLIQHRPCFKVLLTGSHTLEEVHRWASYLINVQVVRIGYLNEAEARQLIERPVKDFALRYEPEAGQRVLDLTRGHPALVQLLCAEIVALKNEQNPAARRLARLVDVEAAVPNALSSGSFFFADIEHNQVDTVGLSVLRYMAGQGEGAALNRKELARQLPDPDDLDQALRLLTRRELIEAIDGSFRFQVELIRRWFARNL